jgi:hypothetical protein
VNIGVKGILFWKHIDVDDAACLEGDDDDELVAAEEARRK